MRAVSMQCVWPPLSEKGVATCCSWIGRPGWPKVLPDARHNGAHIDEVLVTGVQYHQFHTAFPGPSVQLSAAYIAYQSVALIKAGMACTHVGRHHTHSPWGASHHRIQGNAPSPCFAGPHRCGHLERVAQRAHQQAVQRGGAMRSTCRDIGRRNARKLPGATGSDQGFRKNK